MELTLEAVCTAQLRPPIMVGAGPHGVRMVLAVESGELKGPRLSARVLPVGGDWLLVGPDGWGRLDVRAQFETDDGAVVYAQFHGLIEMNDAVARAISVGDGTDYGDQYFRVTPRLETGDENYTWMNQSVFVGEGRFLPGLRLEYKLYRVA